MHRSGFHLGIRVRSPEKLEDEEGLKTGLTSARLYRGQDEWKKWPGAVFDEEYYGDFFWNILKPKTIFLNHFSIGQKSPQI